MTGTQRDGREVAGPGEKGDKAQLILTTGQFDRTETPQVQE
jgi:hypothetical protein